MSRVGRNQPCPCGSGRKYKQCCLPKDQATQVRSLSLRRDEELLRARIGAYAERPGFFADLQSAFSRFWNGDLELDAVQALDPAHLEPFLEWYVYDYRIGEDRQRISDLFAAEEGPRLRPEQQALLAERQAAYLSLYGVEAVDAAGWLEAGDLLVGGLYRLEDAGLARLAMPGDLLLGRRLGDAEASRMSRGTVLLPGSLGPALVATAKRAFGAYRDEQYQATWPEFLREAGYVMFHFLTTPEAAEAYARAPMREGYFDPRAAVEGMHAIMRRKAEEAARKQEAKRARQREEEGETPTAPPIERTAGGILIPGQPKPSEAAQGGILLPEHLRK